MITWLIDLIWGKRNWELIDKTIIPSPMERMVDKLQRAERGSNFSCEALATKQTIILTFKCSLTEKIKIETFSG